MMIKPAHTAASGHSLSHLLGSPGQDIAISSVTSDSRKVEKGDLFVALPGLVHDGRDFIDDAIKRGACAVLSTPDVAEMSLPVPVIPDRNPRRKYSEIAARFYACQPEIEVAVTGTNGKTSVVEFTRQIWATAGYCAASIGTLGVRSDGFEVPGGLTTPDPMALMALLAGLVRSGVSHTAIEASSHGLDQYRLDGVRLQAAAFTNLSRDHLDYHGNFEAYFYAKMRLFGELLLPRQTAVISVDDPRSAHVADLAWGRGLSTILVGRQDACDIRLVKTDPAPTGQDLIVDIFGKQHSIFLPLLGDFQASNALVALGLAVATGVDVDRAVDALSRLDGVSGRMDYAGQTHSGASVVIDYAHTPSGLETALKAVRRHSNGKVAVVFGCGGDRDKGKRPEMGDIALKLADSVFVTDDNPRSEDPAEIRRDIMKACKSATEIADRGRAIETAVASLGSGDILLIAGKGHEEGQIYGDKVLEFSDLKSVQQFVIQES